MDRIPCAMHHGIEYHLRIIISRVPPHSENIQTNKHTMAEQAPPRAQPETQSVCVVAVPFPAQGHLNQLLHFSLHLSSLHVPVHFASSSTHSLQAKTRLQGWTSASLSQIHFHHLPLPPFPSPSPDPTSPYKFPSHLLPSFEASMHLQSPLSSLLRSLSLSSRRLVVVHDPLMRFACAEADSIPNVETYEFQCVTASCMLSFLTDEIENIDDKLSREVRSVVLTPLPDCFPEDFWVFSAKYWRELSSEAGVVMNTCKEIDGEFIELMSHAPRYRNKKLFAIGPMNPVSASGGDRDRHECLHWLDKQPAASVVYVSFGSTVSISDEQIEQLALGLLHSRQRFIWVLKDADKGDIFADNENSTEQRKLPSGFEESTAENGVVVRGWAPQLEILAHPSTGVFVSHCGWNSCIESLSFGVPMIAWPMHSDQPRNAVMVCEYLKVGVLVRGWDRRKETVSGPEVERAIQRLMVDDEGKEIRKRAKGLGEEIRGAVKETGSSKVDFDSFVQHITRC